MNSPTLAFILSVAIAGAKFGQTEAAGASGSNFASAKLEPVSRRLEINENYHANWTVLDTTREIVFQVDVRTKGWVGLGISLNVAMKGADIFVGGFRAGAPYIEDRHGVGNVQPKLDTKQDVRLLRGSRNETHTTLVFSRPFATGDTEQDLDITDDTLRLIWAYGGSEGASTLAYHGTESRGIVSVNFLDPDVETPTAEELEAMYPVWRTQKQVHVPTNDTVYMCSFFKGPNVTRKHHMVGFGMFIDRPELTRHLHHADLYRCVAPAGRDPEEFFAPFLADGYDCNYSPVPFPYDACGLFEFQWTIGGKTTLFPDELGLPIGRDDGATEYYMTEVHFDNPQRRDDLDIRAGFEIYYTPQLRPTEIGQLQLGVMTNRTYALTIPPNSTDFVISSHCPAACTDSLPLEGINIFTYLLHSHLSGRALKLRHFRGDTELATLAQDAHFDFAYQNNRRLRTPVKILPGDHLTFECTYDTTWKGGLTTLGGRSARDEMCQAFLLYYPRNPLVNSCGSYHQQKKILAYMGVEEVYQYQGEIDATITAPAGLAGRKYSKHVEELTAEWSDAKRAEFRKLMQFDRQQAYCTPVHYYNESFVLTEYPVDQREGEDSSNSAGAGDLAVYIAIAVISTLFVVAVWYKMKHQPNKKDGTWGPSGGNQGLPAPIFVTAITPVDSAKAGVY